MPARLRAGFSPGDGGSHGRLLSSGGPGPDVELERSLEDPYQGKTGSQEARKKAGLVVLARENEIWAGTLEQPSQIFTLVLVGGENYSHFTSRKLRLREPMALVQDHTASELRMSIQMSLVRSLGEETGPRFSSRSGAELEPRSPSFPSAEDSPEPLV